MKANPSSASQSQISSFNHKIQIQSIKLTNLAENMKNAQFLYIRGKGIFKQKIIFCCSIIVSQLVSASICGYTLLYTQIMHNNAWRVICLYLLCVGKHTQVIDFQSKRKIVSSSYIRTFFISWSSSFSCSLQWLLKLKDIATIVRVCFCLKW